jgi:hypothetical protein
MVQKSIPCCERMLKEYFHKVHGITPNLINLNDTPNEKARQDGELRYTDIE